MAVKSNNHPLVKDLRRLLDRHGFKGCVLLALDDNFDPVSASAGHDVATCDALGPVLDDVSIDLLFIEMMCIERIENIG